MGHRKSLPGNTRGEVRIYKNTHHINSAIHYCTLQLNFASISIWMNEHGNYSRNLWTTASGHSGKQLTCTTVKKPRILPIQKKIRIVETCVDIYSSHICSGRFWNWLCQTVAYRSSDECIKNI